ncbi:hypothetical protein E0H38_25040, partial [Rhizobium leguminosarum bv. viciae]
GSSPVCVIGCDDCRRLRRLRIEGPDQHILFWTFKPQPPATEPVVQPDAEEEEEEEGPAATAEKPSKDGQAE